MAFLDLHRPDICKENPKLDKNYDYLEQLIHELEQRNIPEANQEFINSEIEQINSISGDLKDFRKAIRKSLMRIFQHLEKELKIVRKGHYRLMWLSLGMSAFGVPMGVAFGVSLNNMAFIGIGIPIGMALGIAVGTGMDQKAKQKGNQLDLGVEM